MRALLWLAAGFVAGAVTTLVATRRPTDAEFDRLFADLDEDDVPVRRPFVVLTGGRSCS